MTMRKVKRCMSIILAFILVISGFTVSGSSAEALEAVEHGTVIFPMESDWEYLNTESELTNNEWTKPDFNSSSWEEGKAPIGYANYDKPMYAALNTYTSIYKRNLTLYVRKSFQVENAEQIDGFYANILYDDAVRVYLNGQVVGAQNLLQNLPDEQYGHHFVGDIPEEVLIWIDGKYLVDGENVIGVEVINTQIESSDLFFDMDLIVGGSLLSKESEWEYLETSTEISDSSWAGEDYGIDAWDSDQAPFGFCSAKRPMESLINTKLKNTKKLFYVRTSFNVESLEEIGTVLASVDFDDGVRVFLNGNFVGQVNVPGVIGTMPVGDQYATWNMQINPEFLVEGENIVGVEVWNENSGSSDIFFDMGIGTMPEIEIEGQQTLIRSGDVWSYSEEPAEPEDGWMTDESVTGSRWLVGHSSFGYSSKTPLKTVEFANSTTKINYGSGSNKPMRVYFHKTIEIEDINKTAGILANVSHDDGLIIFINGHEAGRYYVYGDYKKPDEIGTVYDEVRREDDWLDISALKEGTNVITAVLYNVANTSSDIFFDLELTSYEERPVDAGIKIIRNGDYWSYIDNQTEPADGWMTATEVSSGSWKTGRSEFGYGDTSLYTDINTLINKGSSGNRPLKVYFHTTFEIDNASEAGGLLAKFAYDDGVGLYLNGVEQGHYNVITDENLVSTVGSTPEEDQEWLDMSLIQNGTNVLTAVLYNVSNTSSDIYFDLELLLCEEDFSYDYVVENLGLTPGRDESELNFAWYSPRRSSETSAAQIALKAQMQNDVFPEDVCRTFNGKVFTASQEKTSNQVVVEGLEPETEYVYRVGDGQTWSETYEYTTRSTNDYTAVYLGDIQMGASNEYNPSADGESWRKTAQAAIERTNGEAVFFLSGGDQVNNNNREDQYDEFFSPDELKSYPLVPTIGNHDTETTHHTYHFNKPNIGDNGKTPAGSNNYFSYGNTLYIVLNGNNINAAEHYQTIWEAIDSHPDAKWRILTMHQDIYGSGKEHSARDSMINLRNSLYPIFDDAGIDVVLTAHDHTYTRSHILRDNKPVADLEHPTVDGEEDELTAINPDGILYICANSSTGSKYYPLHEVRQEYVATRSQLYTPTYATMDITDESFSIKTYRVDNGEFLDGYTILKPSQELSKRNELEQLVAEVKELEEEDYTKASWDNLLTMLDRAEEVLDDIEASEKSIEHAYNMLHLARKILEPEYAERVILKIFVEAAEEAITSGEVDRAHPDVQASFEIAYKKAVEVLNDPYSEREDILNIALDLLQELHRLGITVTDVDTQYLQDLYEFCLQLNMDNYKDGAEKLTFLEAMENAREVLEDEDSIQEDIEDAYNELLSATRNLKQKTGSLDELNTLIELAEECLSNENDYVVSGIDILKEALDNARGVIRSLDPSDEEIYRAIEDLGEALAALRYKANKTLLKEAVAKAESIDLSIYTVQSAEKMSAVLADAYVILLDDTLSEDDQENVNDIVGQLQLVIAQMELNEETLSTLEESEDETTSESETESLKATGGDNSKNVGKAQKTNVKTGDENSIVLLNAMMLLSILGIIILRDKKMRKGHK